MSKSTSAVALEPPRCEFRITRPAVLASDQEQKGMRQQRYLSSLRRSFGKRFKRFQVSGEPRQII